MYRRRKPPSREVVFSFDSFLDLVANVVGIIIRLILVVWIGARSYSSLMKPPSHEKTEPPAVALPSVSTEPERAALEQTRRLLAQAQAALMEHLGQQQKLVARREQVVRGWDAVKGEGSDIEKRAAELESRTKQLEDERRKAELSAAELRERAGKLTKQLDEISGQATVKKVLRFPTPVAQVVQSEELHFECRNGRITFLDVEAMVREIRQGLRQKGEQLRTTWQLTEETAPVGAFKLRYVMVREKNVMESVAGGAAPLSKEEFRYGLESWEAVPLVQQRGESVEDALKDGSEFRRIIDRLDPEQTAVTIWVYPDSFAAYRRLRDHCVGRDVLVAGRPLPEGFPIASSRRGTASRGQ